MAPNGISRGGYEMISAGGFSALETIHRNGKTSGERDGEQRDGEGGDQGGTERWGPESSQGDGNLLRVTEFRRDVAGATEVRG